MRSELRISRVWLESNDGAPWKIEDASGAPGAKIDTGSAAAPVSDRIFHVRAADDAPPTEPYFTRPTTEQPYYDISNEAWRERSFAPYPLAAWAEFTFDGVPIRIGQVVQTLARVSGVGGVYEPLVVTPAIGVRVEPEARILPLDGSALPVKVTVHAQRAAEGTVELKLPEGWRSDPAQREFHLRSAGDTEPLVFSVSPAGDVKTRAYAIEARSARGRKKLFDWMAEHRLSGTAALQPIQGGRTAHAQGGCEGGAGTARGLRDGNGRHGSRGH